MRAIDETAGATPGPDGEPFEIVGPAGAPAQCRALARVPEAEPQVWLSPRYQPAATFLAHLIATAHGVPQTRARRRTEPGQACAAYAAAAGLTGS